VIEVPTAYSPADTPPDIDLASLESPPAAGQASPAGRAGENALEPSLHEPADRKITHLFLDPQLTGGCDLDGQPGDDGLRIVVEPRNAAEQFIAEAGSLSIVVLDPSKQGEAARVARWDFDERATRQLLADTAPRRGMRLELPWPGAAPGGKRLQLFIRYVTPDGRRLQVDRELFVTPPGEAISRWTPRTAARTAPPGERDAAERASAAVPVAAGETSQPGHRGNLAPTKRMWPDWSAERDR
jgi:hypothetical protein